MNLFDPHRRRINDMPELIGRRIAVPRLTLFPCEDGTTTVGAMIPDDGHGRYSSRQVLKTVADGKIAEIISHYRADPEGTLETLFSVSLAPIPEPSDVELARGIKRGFDSSAKQSRNTRDSQYSDEEILL